jgi:hypothetical protein
VFSYAYTMMDHGSSISYVDLASEKQNSLALPPPPPPSRAMGSPLLSRPLPPPSTSFLHCRCQQRSPGDAGGGGLPFPAPGRAGRGPPCPWRRCSSGGSGPARPGGGGAVALHRGVVWRSARAEVAAGGGLAMIWATRAQMGSGGLGSLSSWCFLVVAMTTMIRLQRIYNF